MLPILKVIVIVINSFSTKSNCNCSHYIYFQEVIVIVMITFAKYVITTSLVAIEQKVVFHESSTSLLACNARWFMLVQQLKLHYMR